MPTELCSNHRNLDRELGALSVSSSGVHTVCVETQLGLAEITVGERGVSRVEFLDLAVDVPCASATSSFPANDPRISDVLAAIDGTSSRNPPLDLRGTPFQIAVWSELQRIPPGTTITYSDLASRVGRPTATRAVASACGANTIAVLIPCHRVVRSNGELGGYRWGLDRKRILLDRERGR